MILHCKTRYNRLAIGGHMERKTRNVEYTFSVVTVILRRWDCRTFVAHSQESCLCA
jgi:hypothetical protein